MNEQVLASPGFFSGTRHRPPSPPIVIAIPCLTATIDRRLPAVTAQRGAVSPVFKQPKENSGGRDDSCYLTK